ncbi:MAG: twin transmembrane helix small protein [Steroidobacteraceae bacterium]
MDVIKIGVVIALLAIIASLGSALFSLTRSQGNSRSMVRALTVRVVLSVGLFLLLLAAWRLGYIQPHGLQ